jgi:hypothetical protein
MAHNTHNRLVWAVSLDPLTSNILLPSGPPQCHNVINGLTSFVLVLVDAQSIHGLAC